MTIDICLHFNAEKKIYNAGLEIVYNMNNMVKYLFHTEM